MDIKIVMKQLSDSEIGCTFASFCDGGWNVRIGPTNGFMSEANFNTPEECAEFLDHQARIHCPESVYALGKLEHGRREALRLAEEVGKWK
jgi:hypothetical protein